MIRFSDHPEWNFSVKLQDHLQNEPAVFKAPDKILAMSDIEGEFEAFRSLLLANRVIDEAYNWIFGKGHLVICGIFLYDKAKNPELFTDKQVWKLFDGTRSSLFWYCGYFVEPKATEEEVDQTLSLYRVKRIIVGHTITESNVGFYYNGKVLGIDVNQHKGKHEGALYENKQWYKVNTTGSKELL